MIATAPDAASGELEDRENRLALDVWVWVWVWLFCTRHAMFRIERQDVLANLDLPFLAVDAEGRFDLLHE
jgi:hypothetical protein